jgi:hypothetical protein
VNNVTGAANQVWQNTGGAYVEAVKVAVNVVQAVASDPGTAAHMALAVASFAPPPVGTVAAMADIGLSLYEGDYESVAMGMAMLVPGGAALAMAARGTKIASKLAGAASKVAGAASKTLDKIQDLGRSAAKALKGGEKAASKAADLGEATAGVKRGGESAAAAAGRAQHAAKDWGPGFEKEVRLPSGRRVDAIDFGTHAVGELKPGNPAAIARGGRQLRGYLDELNALTDDGVPWTGFLETY